MGCWSVNWSSPTATFDACGDSPTAPHARFRQPVVYAREGAQELTLFYSVAPSHVKVSCNPDIGGELVYLYEGRGKRNLTIPLHQDIRGIYSVSEEWNMVPPASGDAKRGFLVVEEGELVGDPKLEEPPTLIVAATDGTEVITQLGSYSWNVWLGGDSMEGTTADAPCPLEFPDLPTLSAKPGDWLELQFAIPPDKLSLRIWSPSTDVQGEPVEIGALPDSSGLLVPENGGGKVYEVRGSWYLVGEVWCQVSYLFRIS